MGVLINKKRCDNAEECPCILGCPAKAFYYDKEKETVAVHNELCINCRRCMITCEAGAVKVYRNEEEYKKLKTEYDDDAMTVEELFQDRFGAVSVDPKYKCDVKELDNLIADANKPLLIEFYNENEATCLVNSVPIRKILEALENKVSYRKIVVKDLLQIDKFSIIELLALILIDK